MAESDFKDLKTFEEELRKMVDTYKEGLKVIESEYQILLKQQDKLPKKFIISYDFEDALILASQLKHRSIQMLKNSTGLYEAAKIDVDYLESQLLLNVADEFLRDKFDKITDNLRRAFVSSHKGLKSLLKVKGKLMALQEASEKLVRAFESDEVNCRKFVEMKNKLKGM